MEKWSKWIVIILITLIIGVSGVLALNHFVLPKSEQKTPPPLAPPANQALASVSPATQAALPVTAPTASTAFVMIDGMKVISSSPDKIVTEVTVVVKKEFYTAEEWKKRAPKPVLEKKTSPVKEEDSDECIDEPDDPCVDFSD